MLLNNPVGIWSRGNTLEKVWLSLQSKEEQKAFFDELPSRFTATPGEGWKELKGFSFKLLSEWSPVPATISCWRSAFEHWGYQDKIAANVIAVIDKGIRHYLNAVNGYPSLVEKNLILRCLEVMAAGVRPGPGARDCREIISAGLLMFGHRDQFEPEENAPWETFCSVIAMHNQIGYLGTAQGYLPHAIDAEALETMYRSKQLQLGESWPLSFSIGRFPDLITNFQSNPDLQTMVILETCYNNVRKRLL